MAKVRKEDKYFIFDRPITLNFKYYTKRIIYFLCRSMSYCSFLS